MSLNCGQTSLRYMINDFSIICHDKDKSSSIEDAWATYWQSYNGPVPAGMDMGEWASSALVLGEEFKSLAANEIQKIINDDTDIPEGHIPDSPTPLTEGQVFGWSALVPVDFFLQKNEAVHLMVSLGDFHVAGGHVGKLHDQMTALSSIYRISGEVCWIQGARPRPVSADNSSTPTRFPPPHSHHIPSPVLKKKHRKQSSHTRRASVSTY